MVDYPYAWAGIYRRDLDATCCTSPDGCTPPRTGRGSGGCTARPSSFAVVVAAGRLLPADGVRLADPDRRRAAAALLRCLRHGLRGPGGGVHPQGGAHVLRASGPPSGAGRTLLPRPAVHASSNAASSPLRRLPQDLLAATRLRPGTCTRSCRGCWRPDDAVLLRLDPVRRDDAGGGDRRRTLRAARGPPDPAGRPTTRRSRRSLRPWTRPPASPRCARASTRSARGTTSSPRCTRRTGRRALIEVPMLEPLPAARISPSVTAPTSWSWSRSRSPRPGPSPV